MLERAIEILAREEAYVVGGTVRDELLHRPVLDLDIACAEPERAARAYADASYGAPFPLSAAHGGWRVALSEGRTVDFTPLHGSIEDDLATRDFTINAIARPLAGGEHVDPFDGRRTWSSRSSGRSAPRSSRRIRSGCCAPSASRRSSASSSSGAPSACFATTRSSSRGRRASGRSRCCTGWASPAGSASTSSGS